METKKSHTFSSKVSITEFVPIEVTFKYKSLPLKTFLEVNNIILETHDYLIKLFKLDKEPIYEHYRFEIKDLRIGSAIISIEPKFEFPKGTDGSDSKIEKAIKKFALIIAILTTIVKGQEIYIHNVEIDKLNKNTVTQDIRPEFKDTAKQLNFNLDSLLKPKTRMYMHAVKDNLRDVIKTNDIISLHINGVEIKKPFNVADGDLEF